MRDERIARILAAEEVSVQVLRIVGPGQMRNLNEQGFVLKYDTKGNQQRTKIPPGTRSAPDIPIALSIGDKQSNTVTIAVSQ
jgi:hypothetical protein